MNSPAHAHDPDGTPQVSLRLSPTDLEAFATEVELLAAIQVNLDIPAPQLEVVEKFLHYCVTFARSVHRRQLRDNNSNYIEGHLLPTAIIGQRHLQELGKTEADDVICQMVVDLWHDIDEDRAEKLCSTTELITRFGEEMVHEYLYRFNTKRMALRVSLREEEAMTTSHPDTFFVMCSRLSRWIQGIKGLKEILNLETEADISDFIYDCVSSAFRACRYPAHKTTRKNRAGHSTEIEFFGTDAGKTIFRRQLCGESMPFAQRAKSHDGYQNTASSCNLLPRVFDIDDFEKCGDILKRAFKRANDNIQVFIRNGSNRQEVKGKLLPVAVVQGNIHPSFAASFTEKDSQLKLLLDNCVTRLLEDLLQFGESSTLARYEQAWARRHAAHEPSLIDQLGTHLKLRGLVPLLVAKLNSVLTDPNCQRLGISQKLQQAVLTSTDETIH